MAFLGFWLTTNAPDITRNAKQPLFPPLGATWRPLIFLTLFNALVNKTKQHTHIVHCEMMLPHKVLGCVIVLSTIALSQSSRRRHPDDMEVVIQFGKPQIIVGWPTDFEATAIGLAQEVDYRMLLTVLRGGDIVHEKGINFRAGDDASAGVGERLSHTLSSIIPPLPAGAHTVRVRLQDPRATSERDSILGNVVQTVEPLDAPRELHAYRPFWNQASVEYTIVLEHPPRV